MRTFRVAIIAFYLMLQSCGLAYGDEKDQKGAGLPHSTEVAAGVRALSDDVRELREEVKELAALLRSQVKPEPLSVNRQPAVIGDSTPAAPRGVHDAPATDAKNSATAPAMNDDRNRSPVRSGARDNDVGEIKNGLSKLAPRASAVLGSKATAPKLELDVEFRDLSLAEAKKLALKAYRERELAETRIASEVEKAKGEENLLLYVESKYYDHWIAFNVYDVQRNHFVNVVDCWRVADFKKDQSVEIASSRQQLERLFQSAQEGLELALNGGALPKTQGLTESEAALRQAIGISVGGPFLRPTDDPKSSPIDLDFSVLLEKALGRELIKGDSLGSSPRPVSGEALSAQELNVAHQLSTAYRGFQSNSASVARYREFIAANARELEVYYERLLAKQGEPAQHLDNIARCLQRLLQSRLNFYQSLGECNKSHVQLKRLCGDVLPVTE